MKATALAPSNIAFIKYWGRKDESLRIPLNGSISMNLSNLLTTTTVEFGKDLKHDIINILIRHSGNQASPEHPEFPPHPRPLPQGERGRGEGGQASMTGIEIQRVIEHLDKIRSLAKIDYKAKVVSVNNFPTSTGLSSSASGFAALTLAASKAAGLNLSEKELSILARLGSGSACRSIPDGFVEWLSGATNETSYPMSLHTPSYWDIVDVVAIVSKDKKEIPTTQGQQLAKSSPFLPVRLERIKDRISLIKKYLKAKNFKMFGELIEQEALELHAIMITSTPPLIYWLPATVGIMHAVQKWRKNGMQIYFTVNTGQDIHLICQKKDAKLVIEKAKEISDVQRTIINYPSKGAHLISTHLF